MQTLFGLQSQISLLARNLAPTTLSATWRICGELKYHNTAQTNLTNAKSRSLGRLALLVRPASALSGLQVLIPEVACSQSEWIAETKMRRCCHLHFLHLSAVISFCCCHSSCQAKILLTRLLSSKFWVVYSLIHVLTNVFR